MNANVHVNNDIFCNYINKDKVKFLGHAIAHCSALVKLPYTCPHTSQ